MAQQVCVVVSDGEREQLAAIAADRNRPCKHVERARIVLASADRGSAQQVAQSVGVSRPTVWRWQQRFAEIGVEGLLRDKTRKPGKAPIATETTARVVALTCAAPPHQATHWTGRAMAKVAGISVGSVQRIWRAHKLQPHRLRTFKRSRDPSFAAKLADIVGLYLDPPAHAVVLSLDEKSQIQALDRTQPGLPIKPGRCQTMTHDYKRHGTTTLFAALSVLDGTVIGRCMQRHRHLEFIRFLHAVERQVAAGLSIPRRPRQLCHPQASQSAGLASAPSALDLPLHPDLGLLAQCGQELLFQDDATAHPLRRVPLESPTCRPPSMLISPSTMPAPNPSSGPNPPTPSWPNSNASLYHRFEPVHWLDAGDVQCRFGRPENRLHLTRVAGGSLHDQD
jgi:transposase